MSVGPVPDAFDTLHSPSDRTCADDSTSLVTKDRGTVLPIERERERDEEEEDGD
jgi:hypothetical protein